MAFINVKDATVDRIIFNGKGARVYEEFTKRDGETGRAYFTAWFQNEITEFNEGDLVNVSGNISVKVSEYVDKEGIERTSADVNINNAKAELADL